MNSFQQQGGLIAGAECKGETTGSGSGTVTIAGPLVVDLMTGVTTPDLSGLRRPAGTYKRIDFRLEEGRADELPEKMREGVMHFVQRTC